MDNDCDGSTDENLGKLKCGIGECANEVDACKNGISQVCVPKPPTAEKCDLKDNDCDGSTDEENAKGCTTYSLDADEDGFGSPFKAKCLCKPSGLYDAENELDCNDSDSKVNPDAEELCNGNDDNCNEQVDEGFPDADQDGLHDCEPLIDFDSDNDGIPDDGDEDGIVGDSPCEPGVEEGCDDNCPYDANSGQQDVDLDGIGDLCDPDTDGDEVFDDGDGSTIVGDQPCRAGVVEFCDDNCRFLENNDQTDIDGDGVGDVCDPDQDEDGILDDGNENGVRSDGFNMAPDGLPDCDHGEPIESDWSSVGVHQCSDGAIGGCDDNCPRVPNPEQTDTDGDANPVDGTVDWIPLYIGDEPCDDDDDNDGLLDSDEILCTTDPKQWDTDGDGYSDFVELLPAAWPAPEGLNQHIDLYCCLDAEEQTECLEGLVERLGTEAALRNGPSTDGSPLGEGFVFCLPPSSDTHDRLESTDPNSDKDLPGHVLPPGTPVSGGGGSCVVGTVGNGLVSGIALFFLLIGTIVTLRRRGQINWRLFALCLAVFSVSSMETGSAFGWDMQVFRPLGMGRGGYGTQTSDTLWAGQAGAQIVYSFLYAPLVARPAGESGDITLVKTAQTLQFEGSLGLINRLELDVQLPVYIDRTADAKFGSELGGTDVGDLYIGLRYQVLRRDRNAVGLTFTPFLLLATGSPSKMTGSGNYNFGLNIALDKQFWFVTLAINVGMTRRQDDGFLPGRIGSRLHTTFDYAALIKIDVTPVRWMYFFGEINGMYEILGNDGHTKSLMLTAGFRAPIGPVDLTLGYGRGLTRDFGTPAHMAFVGMGIYRWPDAPDRFEK